MVGDGACASGSFCQLLMLQLVRTSPSEFGNDIIMSSPNFQVPELHAAWSSAERCTATQLLYFRENTGEEYGPLFTVRLKVNRYVWIQTFSHALSPGSKYFLSQKRAPWTLLSSPLQHTDLVRDRLSFLPHKINTHHIATRIGLRRLTWRCLQFL